MTAFSRVLLEIFYNFIKVDGDLDIDFDALLSDNTSDNKASDEEGNTFLILSTESRTQSARRSRSRLYWRFGPVHKLPVDSEPVYNFGLFFGNKSYKLMADIEITNWKK